MSRSSGPLHHDHRKVPYTKVQRPIWPLDEMRSQWAYLLIEFCRDRRAASP